VVEVAVRAVAIEGPLQPGQRPVVLADLADPADPILTPKPRSNNPSNVEAALRTVDRALDPLCSTLGLSAAPT